MKENKIKKFFIGLRDEMSDILFRLFLGLSSKEFDELGNIVEKNPKYFDVYFHESMLKLKELLEKKDFSNMNFNWFGFAKRMFVLKDMYKNLKNEIVNIKLKNNKEKKDIELFKLFHYKLFEYYLLQLVKLLPNISNPPKDIIDKLVYSFSIKLYEHMDYLTQVRKLEDIEIVEICTEKIYLFVEGLIDISLAFTKKNN